MLAYLYDDLLTESARVEPHALLIITRQCLECVAEFTRGGILAPRAVVETGQTKMRRTYLAVVRFFKSLGLKVGPDEDRLVPIFDTVPALPLVTGDRRKLPIAPWDDETEMVFKMEDPLPCFILAILLESEVEEKG